MTRKVCLPFASPEYFFGDLHPPQGLASSSHWKVEPASPERKRNVAFREPVFPDGRDEMVLCGGVGGGVGVEADQATAWLVQRGTVVWTESVLCACWGARNEPLKRTGLTEASVGERVVGDRDRPIGIDQMVVALTAPPHELGTFVRASRVTLAPSAETSKLTVPPRPCRCMWLDG